MDFQAEFVLDPSEPSGPVDGPRSEPLPAETQALDAYSRVVTAVVDIAAAAVVAIVITERVDGTGKRVGGGQG